LEKLLNEGSGWLARTGLACLVTLDINTFELDSISTHGLGTLGIIAPPTLGKSTLGLVAIEIVGCGTLGLCSASPESIPPTRKFCVAWHAPGIIACGTLGLCSVLPESIPPTKKFCLPSYIETIPELVVELWRLAPGMRQPWYLLFTTSSIDIAT